MFAAASGARLAHRHNKATIKKQLGTSNTDGLQTNSKAFEKSQHAKYSDTPGIHGLRKPQRCYHNYTSKLNSDSESVSKLSSSYVDLHGKIPKFGHVDFEGKSAWQDRERSRPERREPAPPARQAAAQRAARQRAAQKRWVKKNQIHDTRYGEGSSDEEEAGAYGAQNSAANVLLYVGLGTICIGMIIAFVGTGDKGFKTIELRLIGPSLIGTGLMITIIRVLLCVCPSKCFRRHKSKKSTTQLRVDEERGEIGEGNERAEWGRDENPEPAASEIVPLQERPRAVRKKSDGKKRVSIAEMPATSSTCERGEAGARVKSNLRPVEEKVFTRGKKPHVKRQEVVKTEKPFDICSIGSDVSIPSHIMRMEAKPRESSIKSDISVSSHVHGFLDSDSFDSELSSKTVKNASKFESQISPKFPNSEILLDPSNLNE